MTVFSSTDFTQHEQVVFGHDPASGLKAIIAIHNTHLGNALGGCRMFPYANEKDALRDVLRLSRGMTYKSALARLPCGGGKSIIIGDPRVDKSTDLFKAMGRLVESMSGKYLVAQDSGISAADLSVMNSVTGFVAGIQEVVDDSGMVRSGDPSHATALGVFNGIRTAIKHRMGADNLSSVKVAIQGIGNVGFDLAKRLREDGAQLYVCDINENSLARARIELDAEVVSGADIHGLDVDVFSPCALGGSINDETVNVIKAPIVAGAANNQLNSALHGDILHRRGILYAPDYVINAGGVVHVHYMHSKRNWEESVRHICSLAETLAEIFQRSYCQNQSTALVADQLAEEIYRPFGMR